MKGAVKSQKCAKDSVRYRMNRTDAARIGGMDRQTLRDWVHRFNDQGPDGLRHVHAGGVEPRLSAEKLAELAAIVEAGTDREKDGDPDGEYDRRCTSRHFF